MKELNNEMLIEEDTLKDKFLTFQLGKGYYGIDIEYVTEIIGILPITEVPELPDYIKGIVNLRGNIVPVMDVRIRFKKDFREYNERTCIIVIDILENLVGLIVDSVSEVTNIPEDKIVQPPTLNTVFSNKYIKGIGKVDGDVKLILNCEKLLSEDELEAISEVYNEEGLK